MVCWIIFTRYILFSKDSGTAEIRYKTDYKKRGVEEHEHGYAVQGI